jgi:hypothetical protein
MNASVLLFATLSWPATARLAGAFADVGTGVSALAPKRSPVLVSRYVTRPFAFRPLAPLESLRHAIWSAPHDLVVPCDERAALLLQRLYEAANRAEPSIATLIRRSLGDPEVYERLVSRSGFIGIASKLGVCAPETRAVRSEGELERHLVTASYPLVLTLDGTSGGEGAAIARGREEAVAAYGRLMASQSRLHNLARAVIRGDFAALDAALHPGKKSCSLQAFVAGARCSAVFACWQGNLLASIHLEAMVQDGAGRASVVKRIECAEMELAAKRIAARFRLSGLHGLDFVRDAEGKTYLVAMNPRAVQASYLPFGPGRDLAAALLGALTRAECAPRPAIAENEVAFFPGEWRRDPQSAYLISAFHDVPWDDPAVLRQCLGFPGRRRLAHDAAPAVAQLPGDNAGLVPLRHTS